MNNDTAGGCLVILLQIVPIIAWISSGYFAWQTVEPSSFLGAIGFMILWGIYGKILDIALVLLVGTITSFFE